MGGGGGGWANPLQTLALGLVLTLTLTLGPELDNSDICIRGKKERKFWRPIGRLRWPENTSGTDKDRT